MGLFKRVKKESQDAIRKWKRKKNITILVLLLLYFAVKLALYYQDHFGSFVPRPLLVLIGALPLIFITLFFANIVARITSSFFSDFFRDELEPEQRVFFVKMFDLLIYAAAIGYLLYSFGMTLSTLVTFLGFVAIGLALAVREPVLAFFVWLLVLNKKPFRLGDVIRVGPYEGRVERIGTFYITLSQASKLDEHQESESRFVKVPNKVIIDTYIENRGSGSVSQSVRLQLRTVPKDLVKTVKECRVIAADALQKEGVDAEITARVEHENAAAGDRQYLVVRYACPWKDADRIRGALSVALLTRQRALFVEKERR